MVVMVRLSSLGEIMAWVGGWIVQARTLVVNWVSVVFQNDRTILWLPMATAAQS